MPKKTNKKTSKKKTTNKALSKPKRLYGGKLLHKLRTDRGWTASDVGVFIGVSMSLVRMHESGVRNMTQEQARRYAKLYQLDSPMDFFLGQPDFVTPRKALRNADDD